MKLRMHIKLFSPLFVVMETVMGIKTWFMPEFEIYLHMATWICQN